MAILELKLATERRIWASSLFMESTYSGLFWGEPYAEMNDRLIARLPKRATHILGPWPVQVIEPPRRAESVNHPTPWGPVEYLPTCWIAAEFTSLPLDDA